MSPYDGRLAGPLVSGKRIHLGCDGCTPRLVCFGVRPRSGRIQELAWRRADQAFVAAGACHILAWEFVARHPSYRLVGLRKVGEQDPSHVIATDGTWAFDHDGWTPESELLAETAAYEPAADWELLPITTDLATFCADHRHRAPEYFHHDPRPRARAYIDRFASSPPV